MIVALVMVIVVVTILAFIAVGIGLFMFGLWMGDVVRQAIGEIEE